MDGKRRTRGTKMQKADPQTRKRRGNKPAAAGSLLVDFRPSNISLHSPWKDLLLHYGQEHNANQLPINAEGRFLHECNGFGCLCPRRNGASRLARNGGSPCRAWGDPGSRAHLRNLQNGSSCDRGRASSHGASRHTGSPDRGHHRPGGKRNSRFQPGDRVGIAWLHHACGQCVHCGNGRENLCESAIFTGYHVPGGYAELAVAPEDFAYPIPPVFNDTEAAPCSAQGSSGTGASGEAGAVPDRPLLSTVLAHPPTS